MDLGVYNNYKEALEHFVSHHPDLEDEIRHFFNKDWMNIYTVKEDSEKILFNWANERSDIYILSNYAADGFTYVSNKFSFFSKAKGLVCSAFEKCMKPDSKIYKILLERYNLKPEETVFIDDLEENIIAARKLGINGIVFTTAQEVKERLIELGLSD